MNQTASPGANAHAGVRVARAFFAGGDATGRAPARDDTGRSIFQLGEAEVPDDLRPLEEELAADLLALLGIGAAYVNRQAERRGTPALRYDPQLWASTLSHLPLLGPSSFQLRTLTRTVQGRRLPDDLLEAVLGAAGGALLPARAFTRYLARQQAAVRAALDRDGEYSVVAVRLVVDQVAESAPGLVARMETSIARITARKRSGPGEGADVTTTEFTVESRTASTLFAYEQLRDPVVREEFEELLRVAPREDVQATPNFFNGILPPPAK